MTTTQPAVSNIPSATPTHPQTTTEDTINALARAFSKGKTVRLGRFRMTYKNDGWHGFIHIVDTLTEEDYTHDFRVDGFHHAANEAYRWWNELSERVVDFTQTEVQQ